MKFSKKYELAILPQRSTECFDKKCINIYSYKNLQLYPNVVYKIHLGLYVDLSQGHILQVKNHLCDKPWRIVESYLYPSSWFKSITVQIISDKRCIVRTGEVLAHIQSLPVSEALRNLKGKIWY